MLRYLHLFVFLFAASTLAGQVKFVNEFLNIGVGARAHGMANSVVASVSDGTSGYWNTACLTDVDRPFQINAMRAVWFGGVANYDYFSITKRLNKKRSSYFGLSFIRLGIDDIPNTLNLIGPDGTVNYDKITNFSAADYAVLLSYATTLDRDKKFAVGGNVKIIRRVIGPFAGAWGFGADLSMKYKINKRLTLGVAGRDITTTFNAWTFDLDEESKEVFRNTNNEIPQSSTESTLPRVIGGIAYHNNFGKWSLLGEADLNFSTDGRQSGVVAEKNISVEPSFGVEFGFLNRVFVRAGLGNIQQSTNPTTQQLSTTAQPNVGLGLKLGRLKIDYALANVASVNGTLSSHIFSLKLDFNERTNKENSSTPSN